jgi:two-component system sensor histidine kinase HydH
VKAPAGPRRAFLLVSALFLIIVTGLVWAMAIRENAARRIDLEFEAYRNSTILVEEFLQDPNSLSVNESIIGLGIYSPRGEALLRQGTAPESLALPRTFLPSFRPSEGGRSVILIRPLGAEEGSGRMGMGGPMRGMMGSSLVPPFTQGAPPFTPGSPEGGQRQPRILWLEFSSGSRVMAAFLTLGAAALVSLAIGGLYILLVRLYRRNLDLLEREAKNRELIQLGEAARTLAHEIKNPLAVIRIQTASMRRMEAKSGADAGQGLAERILVIDEEVARITALSDRIREFLKGGSGSPRLLDLDHFLEDFAGRYRGAGGGKGEAPLALQGLPSGLRVMADPERLSQALDNVVLNAFEACPQGPEVGLRVERHGRMVEIAIEDNGPGVDPGLEGRLFEPFFTTKEKGSGIGLALASRIAEASGGSLSYHRREGGGASFVFSLPLE